MVWPAATLPLIASSTRTRATVSMSPRSSWRAETLTTVPVTIAGAVRIIVSSDGAMTTAACSGTTTARNDARRASLRRTGDPLSFFGLVNDCTFPAQPNRNPDHKKYRGEGDGPPAHEAVW